MSTAWVPPRPTYHLRIFAICLVLVLLCLLGFLFAVRREAVVPATGIIRARHQEEIRSKTSGIVELGWWEGALADGGTSLCVRVDGKGNGLTDPARGKPLVFQGYRLPDG